MLSPPLYLVLVFAVAALVAGVVAWQLTRSPVEKHLAALGAAGPAAAPQGVVPASGKELVLGNLAFRAPRLRSAVVVRESRDAAVVAVEEEGRPGSREVPLVREGGVWRVVLPFDN